MAPAHSTVTTTAVVAFVEPLAGAPVHGSSAELKAGQSAAAEMHPLGVTAEPTFSPKPGKFDGGTAVTLRCDTPGATIHFTVDGSQPIAGSPLYEAAIMLKGSRLTIKSFAGASGKKDSADVTGTFGIRE